MPTANLHSNETHSHIHCDHWPLQKHVFTCTLPSFSLQNHTLTYPLLSCSLLKHTFTCHSILYSTETHDHMHNKYCTPQNHTFTCSLLSYTLEKHTFIWPLLSLHSTETHIHLLTTILHSTNTHFHATWFPALYRNTHSRSQSHPALYRNAYSYAHCILHTTVTFTHISSATLPSTETHLHMPTANLHSIEIVMCPLLSWTLQIYLFSFPLYSTETHIHMPAVIRALNINTYSDAHCYQCTHTVIHIHRPTAYFTDTHNPISLLSWIVQTYIPIPLLFPTLQKHTFTCPLPFCILQKHTFTYPLHIALHRNTHSHAATFNALKMNTLPCLLPSLYSTVAHIHRPIAVFHSTGTHILMPTALLHYIETAFTFPLPTAFHTEFTCPLYKALYRNIHSNAHYYQYITINKYSQPHNCPEFYKKHINIHTAYCTL